MKGILGKRANLDLTEGSVFKTIVTFAIPLFLSNVFQQLYNTMDTIIIGHTLGDTALAAMGSATAIYDLIIGFALGVGNGLTIVTARSFGCRDEKQLKKSVASSLVIGIVLSVLITVLARFILYPFLQVLHTPEEIIEDAYAYISTIMLFVIVMFAYNLLSGILRAVGNSVMPLIFLMVSSILNIGLDILLIVGFDMGIRGAAVATVISQAVSVVLCVIYIIRKTKWLIPAKEHFAADADLYKEMIAQGLSMGFMNCIVNAGTAILQSGINNLGYLVIAGHTAARKLFSFLSMPFLAMSQTMSTYVSQNYGAGKRECIRSGMKCAYLSGVVMSVAVTVLMLFLAPAMVRLLSGSSEAVVLENGALYLRVVAPSLMILEILICTRSALQAIGAKILPVLSSVIELVGKILFVILFIPRYQYLAVVFCEPVIWCFMVVELVLSFWRNPFIRGKKNRSEVREDGE